MAHIIRSVGEEFGAVGEGFGPGDLEVDNLSASYTKETKSLYVVACIENKIVGGCGIAEFDNQNKICELRKLFLLPEARGHGIGKQLVLKCLEYAKQNDFTHCYLDTLKTMVAARKLYEQLGFSYLDKPIEGVVHTGCDVWMIKVL